VVASAGYTPREIETAVKRECRNLPKTWVREKREPLPGMDAAARMLELWYSDTRYLDSNANPRPLPLRGETLSLESFSLQIAPNLAVEEVLRHLLHPGVLRETEAGYVPRDRVLWIRGSGNPYHAHSLRTLNAMVGTLLHNAKPQRSTRGWMDLQVVHERVPTRQILVLDQQVRQSGRAFLFDTETRFRQSARESKPADPAKLVLVGVYWCEEPALPSERRRGRRRRRPK